MAIQWQSLNSGKVIEIQLSEKLTKDDYGACVPLIEQLLDQHGKIRMLVVMRDFHGWTPGALWEDIKFDMHHFKDIERLAFVGENRWQKGMALFCKPFTSAAIRYFQETESDKALEWLHQA